MPTSIAAGAPGANVRRYRVLGRIRIFRYLPPAFSGPAGTITLGPGIVTRSQRRIGTPS